MVKKYIIWEIYGEIFKLKNPGENGRVDSYVVEDANSHASSSASELTTCLDGKHVRCVFHLRVSHNRFPRILISAALCTGSRFSSVL